MVHVPTNVARGRQGVKILQVSPYDFPYPGGVTQHIINLDRELRARGHEVQIMAPSTEDSVEDTFPDFVRVGSKVIPLPVNQSRARLTLSPQLLPRVRRFLKENHFDVIHLQEPLVPALPLTVLRYSKTINVGTFHAARNSAMFYRTTRPLIQRLQRRLHGKIAVSEAARELVFNSYKSSYRIIPNGIDSDYYGAPQPPAENMENDKFNVLFVGRLEKRKGLQYLLRAWELVQQMRPASRLTVIGAFRQKQLRSYQRQASDLRLRDVIFKGFVSDDEKRRHLQSADVYCSPATGGESQGIALLEAMAAGTPVVASDIPGFRTVLVERNAAILVPPKDHVALARSLVRLSRNSEKRQQLANAGRLRAQDFAWSTIADRVIAYYEELVNESEIGGPYWTQSSDLVGTGHPE